MRSEAHAFAIAAAMAVGGAGCSACESGTGPTAAASASASAPAPAASAAPVAIPIDPAEVAKIVNPSGKAPYDGPTGTLKGKVTVSGDDPVAMSHSFGAGCGEAAASYGKLFRVGQDDALADVLVAVTGYDGFVPEQEDVEKVVVRGCAFDTNTIAMTYGQRLEVSNIDVKTSYMPYLDGAPFRAVMVAVPGGDPIKLYPQEPGRYLLRDQMKRPFLVANVFVLKYPTHAVTDLDGSYEIANIPVGKVKVNALLPMTRKTTEQEIEIKEGDNTLDLVIDYDAEADVPQEVPEPVWGDRKLPE